MLPIACRIFIGQASGKGVGSGMKQSEQKKVLTDFRSGAFNTLVATCIGEEGLDIPQVLPLTEHAVQSCWYAMWSSCTSCTPPVAILKDKHLSLLVMHGLSCMVHTCI